jgi:hypothetical protein
MLVTLPAFVRVVSTCGKSGAHLLLKSRLPAMRVDPLAVASAPTPLASRRAEPGRAYVYNLK